MEDRNHGLARTKPNNGIYNTQHSQQTCAYWVKFEFRGTRKIEGGINLYIELQEQKLDQIAARNIWISLDKPIAFWKLSYGVDLRRKTKEDKYDNCYKNQPTVLADSSNNSRARRHTAQNACKATHSQ